MKKLKPKIDQIMASLGGDVWKVDHSHEASSRMGKIDNVPSFSGLYTIG